MQPLDGLGRSLLLGMDISDLNWQSDNQQHQLQSLSLGKLILSRLRHVSHGHLAEAVQEILESLSGAFQMQAIALLLGDGKGFCTVFASHVRPGSDSLLRPTLQLADDDLREGAGARLLRRGEGASTLLRQIGEDALYLVPAAMRGGRLGHCWSGRCRWSSSPRARAAGLAIPRNCWRTRWRTAANSTSSTTVRASWGCCRR